MIHKDLQQLSPCSHALFLSIVNQLGKTLGQRGSKERGVTGNTQPKTGQSVPNNQDYIFQVFAIPEIGSRNRKWILLS